MSLLKTPGGVAVGALLIATAIALRLLGVSDMDPTVFTALGEESTAITEYAVEKLGREVWTRRALGHDGRFFFVQANDPWLTDPEANAAILDRPVYRSQRMLYPMIAGGAGLFPASVIVWALPIVNVVMLAVGSGTVAAISLKHGGPAWAGYAFVLNAGLLSDLFIDGAGIVAFGLACIGAWALEEDRVPIAASAFVGAALTREVMVLFIGVIALFWWIKRKVVPWGYCLPAAAALLGWATYTRNRIGVDPALEQTSELTILPFSGLVAALGSGRATLSDYLVIGMICVLVLLVPYRALKSGVYLTWGAVGFAVLAPFLTTVVWQKSFDIARALAPLLTVFVVELLLARERHSKGSAGPEPPRRRGSSRSPLSGTSGSAPTSTTRPVATDGQS